LCFRAAELPRTREVLAALNLRRPHFLDGDLRFPVSETRQPRRCVHAGFGKPEIRFQGEMERQVYWWRKRELPDLEALADSSIWTAC